MTAPRRAGDKILTRDDATRRLRRPRDFTLVFTNGVFDVLHRGHTHCLATARTFGERLVVAVNSDASVRALNKGPGRPIHGEVDRALVVAALECVDWVCLFDEDSPAALLTALLPDVLVKGADYALDAVVGRDIVERAGGRVELVPLVEGLSSTEIITRARTQEPAKGRGSTRDG